MKQTALIVFLLALTACVTQGPADYERWAVLPTPPTWAPGSKWAFIVLDKNEKLIQSIAVVLTEQKVESCTKGDWRHVEILSQQPSPNPQFLGVSSYSLKGRAFTMNLAANLCDSKHVLSGKLSETSIIGAYYSASSLGGEYLGHFIAVQTTDIAEPNTPMQPIAPNNGAPSAR